jgi:hypothetical protein
MTRFDKPPKKAARGSRKERVRLFPRPARSADCPLCRQAGLVPYVFKAKNGLTYTAGAVCVCAWGNWRAERIEHATKQRPTRYTELDDEMRCDTAATLRDILEFNAARERKLSICVVMKPTAKQPRTTGFLTDEQRTFVEHELEQMRRAREGEKP